MTTSHTPCVVYGDPVTCHELRTETTNIASCLHLDPIDWFSDPTGLRGLPGPHTAPALADALARCAATGSALLIPYVADTPSEQNTRLVAHWLDRHGLQLFVGPREYLWSRPTDELDFAMRRQLDAAADLNLAVAVAGNMPDLDRLANDLLLGPQSRAALAEARAVAAMAGTEAPGEPQPRQPWPARHASVMVYASWLCGHRSQAFVAMVLNEMGVRTRSGRTWTQPAVSRILLDARPTSRRAV